MLKFPEREIISATNIPVGRPFTPDLARFSRRRVTRGGYRAVLDLAVMVSEGRDSLRLPIVVRCHDCGAVGRLR